jgi:FeS assembly SUF system protein|tara:strand:+ start:306 stop:608 length:303 start_codon:yes stop_codon:yes gene_type:complete
MEEIVEKIISVIKTIYDPEIPVNIYELGLIYDVSIIEKDVRISMTLTSPNCPVAESLPNEVKEKVLTLDEVDTCLVLITFDPPWTAENMSDECKLELGML